MKQSGRRARLRQIVSVFARHGLRGGFRGITNPAEWRKAFEELGPSFVKIGQILSTRPDIVPEPFIREFRKLQDDVRPEPFEHVRAVVEEELGRPLGRIFRSFSPRPSASASMAQVHKAELPDGRPVVVKVQRPGVRETMFQDIAILRALSRLERVVPEGGVLNLRQIVAQIELTARQELDFLHEARNMRTFADNNRGVRYVGCPAVFEPLTTRRVLVMEQIGGFCIDDVDGLRGAGYDPGEIGRKLSLSFMKQVFEDGFFHADPHPGNLRVSDGKIVFLDFGLSGALSAEMRGRLMRLLEGLALDDVEEMTRAVMGLGVQKGRTDFEALEADVAALYKKYISASLYDIRLGDMIAEVFAVCRKSRIGLPAEFALLGKALGTVEGVLAKIAPGLSMMDVAVPYARRQTLQNAARQLDAQRQAEDLALAAMRARRLPRKLSELLENLVGGRTTVRIELKNRRHTLDELNRMVNRLVFGLIVAALIVGSSVVVYADAGPRIFGMSAIGILGYLGAAVLGFWLLISMLHFHHM